MRLSATQTACALGLVLKMHWWLLQGVPLRHVTPSAARDALGRHAADCHRLLDRAAQLAPVLAYVLSDCDCTSGATLRQLVGVLPLPTADGGLGLLAAHQQEQARLRVPQTFVVTEPLERLLVGQCGEFASSCFEMSSAFSTRNCLLYTWVQHNIFN
jgi:hypothetical protein